LPHNDGENFPQFLIGYQYFGGISQWTPTAQLGVIPGTHSPVKLDNTAKSYWCIAADLDAKINGSWGGSESGLGITDPTIVASYKFWPPHRKAKAPYPDGGNEVFVDGSASWCKVETMHNFTSWNTVNEMWFYQREDDLSLGSQILYSGPTYKWTGNN
jgi:hypothetical protein